MKELVDKWDKSHVRIPDDKEVSTYAIEVEKSFPRNSVVCELGGGKGVDAMHFLAQGHQVVLIDISPYALEEAVITAINNNYTLEVKQVNLGKEAVPIIDNYFDVLYSRLTIHYFNKEETLKILKDIYRILKPGASAYITVKSPEDVEEMAYLKATSKQIEDNVYSSQGFIKSRFTKDQWSEMVRASGIREYEIDSYLEVINTDKDIIKSGKDKLELIEIIIKK